MQQVRADMQSMRAEMVTKQTFDNLVARVGKLEASPATRNADATQWQFLQSNLTKLDPANRSIAFSDFDIVGLWGGPNPLMKTLPTYEPPIPLCIHFIPNLTAIH